MLLKDILRGDWGFKGYVVSDCGAIDDIYRGTRSPPTPLNAAALRSRAAPTSPAPAIVR